VVLIDSVARQRCLDKASIIWYTLWKIIVSNWCFLTLIAEADELIGDNGNDELNGDEEDMVDVGDEERGGEQEEQAKEDKDLVENVQKVLVTRQSIKYICPYKGIVYRQRDQ
jgi:hypothetical protein